MHLQLIDGAIVLFTLVVGFLPVLSFGKRTGKKRSEYLAAGRSVPRWLAGLSMVATTFSSDTPNGVTEPVRRYEVAVIFLLYFCLEFWSVTTVLTPGCNYERPR